MFDLLFAPANLEKPSLEWSALIRKPLSSQEPLSPFYFPEPTPSIEPILEAPREMEEEAEEPEPEPCVQPSWEEGFEAGYQAGVEAQTKMLSDQEKEWRHACLVALQQAITSHQTALDQMMDSFLEQCFEAIMTLFPILTDRFGAEQWRHVYEVEWKPNLPQNQPLEIRIHPASKAWIPVDAQENWQWIFDPSMDLMDFRITWDGKGCQKRYRFLLDHIQEHLVLPVLNQQKQSNSLLQRDLDLLSNGSQEEKTQPKRINQHLR